MALLGNEEGVIQDMRGGSSDDCHGSLIVLDIILTVSLSAGGKEELAGLTLAQEAS
jgi:hypothetical protein